MHGPNSGVSATSFNASSNFSYDQDESHFTAWCMMNSPLMLGTDLRRVEISSNVHKVISNADVIALNQDALGVPCKRIKTDNVDACIDYYDATKGTTRDYFQRRIRIEHLDVRVRPLANGDMAVMLFKLEKKSRSIALSLDEIVNRKDADGSSIAYRMAPGAYSKFIAADKYYFKDLRTKLVTAVSKTGTFVTTPDLTPSMTGSTVICVDGVISADLAPYASVTYRISLAEPKDITAGIAFDYQELEAGASIRALATLASASEDAVDAIVIMALYDKGGKLEEMKISDARELSPSGMITVNTKMTMPGDITGKTLKAFLWEANTFIPICAGIELNSKPPATN
jgi:hypothetical protein